MARPPKSIFVLLIMILVLTACSANRKKRGPREAPDKLYTKALSRYNKGQYETAREFFTDVKNYYPGSPEALRAEIKIADCHYFLAEYEEAIALYEEFRKLHPYHEDIPYVLFQIGQAYFRQISTPDRDPNPARQALSNFQYLIENYPPSIFTQAAKEKIERCRYVLAEHEFLVGRFYLKKDKFQGAIARFEEVMRMYPDTDVAPKALYYMGRAFQNLSLNGKAKTAFMEIIDSYPDSEYASKAKARLSTEWDERDVTTGTKGSPEIGTSTL